MGKKIKTTIFALIFLVILLAAFHFTIGESKQNAPKKLLKTNGPAKNAKKEDWLLGGKTIVIDPGHGGNDGGSIGQNGTLEKDVTLKTALKVEQQLLKKTKATVILTRDADEYVSLKDRVKVAHKKSADLFISIHYDAFTDHKVQGMTTYFYNIKDAGLAQMMHEHLLDHHLNTRDRGVAIGDYYVLRDNLSPAILLELGYISNLDDEKRINSEAYQDKEAEAITDGIIEYLKSE